MGGRGGLVLSGSCCLGLEICCEPSVVERNVCLKGSQMTNKPIKIVRNHWYYSDDIYINVCAGYYENTATLGHLVTCAQRSTQHCFRLGFHHDLYA